MFSVFASQLKKKELPTFEVLMEELKNIKLSGIKPIVKEMIFTTDFCESIVPYLSKMEGHTKFFQFKIIRDKYGNARLFLKEDELDPDSKFPHSVKLFKTVPSLKNLKVTKFREETEYNKIFTSIWTKYIPNLEGKYPAAFVEKVKQAWEERIKFLISLKESDYDAFEINMLRKQNNQRLEVDTPSLVKRKDAQITASFYPLDTDTFKVDDLKAGDNLVFYTEAKSTRPWIGLCIDVVSDEGRKYVDTQWLKRERNLFSPWFNTNGEAYTSRVDCESIMFHNILVAAPGDKTSVFTWPDQETKREVMKAYTERDEALNS